MLVISSAPFVKLIDDATLGIDVPELSGCWSRSAPAPSERSAALEEGGSDEIGMSRPKSTKLG